MDLTDAFESNQSGIETRDIAPQQAIPPTFESNQSGIETFKRRTYFERDIRGLNRTRVELKPSASRPRTSGGNV